MNLSDHAEAQVCRLEKEQKIMNQFWEQKLFPERAVLDKIAD